MTERYQTQRAIRIIIVLFLLVILFGYTGYEIKKVVFGPRITITSPYNDEVVSTSSLLVIGVAKNIQEISLDDRAISIDEQGNFNEEILLSPGYNVISVKASDKFGSKTEKTLEVVYQESVVK